MRKIELDVRNIGSVGAFHIYLAYILDFPSWYGRNLDALHDMLVQESEETLVVLAGPAQKGSEMETYMPRLIEVFEDSAEENEKLSFQLK